MSWVALELTHLGETENDLEKIRKEILKVDSDAEVFIPVHTYKKNGKTYNKSLMDGYLFVNLADPGVLFNLENTSYFKQVLTSTDSENKERYATRIRDSEIQRMKAQMAHMYRVGLAEGDVVNITEGLWKDMEATVLELRENDVLVKINLRSLESIIELPKIFVEKV